MYGNLISGSSHIAIAVSISIYVLLHTLNIMFVSNTLYSRTHINQYPCIKLLAVLFIIRNKFSVSI